MPVDVEYDEVVVNLKVIASICVNTKLYTKGAYLNIEQPMFIPESLRRWYRQDSRDEAIKRIDRTIARSIAYLEKDKEKERAIVQYLDDAKKGIINMKDTYSTCVQTMARLDTILDKIETSMALVKIEDIQEAVSNTMVENIPISNARFEKSIDSGNVISSDNFQILPINIKKNK
jgi:hypothetical protein|uniref:Uncharacterized protein n=1 Tax=viral metagenome TaxID=1070528 RepID=A0A6C0E5J0_9ZZZZ